MADASLDFRRSRAILFGTARYDHLPPVPAALNSLVRMEAVLTGDQCGWPRERVSVFPDQLRPGDLPDQLVEIFRDVEDVALFYYVGHGQVDPSDTLCLGLVESRTDPPRRRTTSLPFDAVRYALTQSRAKAKIVILDCCYAGLAAPGGLAAADVLDRTRGTGAYTLAAAGEFEVAWFETGDSLADPQTYFTKYLSDVIERGIPQEGPILRLEPIFHEAEEALARDGKPVPTSRAFGDAHRLMFARNAATRKYSGAELDRGTGREYQAYPPPTEIRIGASLPGSGDLTEELIGSDLWVDGMVWGAGIPVIEVPFVSVGGGIGSFVTIDYLRIAGVSADRMAVLSNLDYPWQTFEYLTRVSQIPRSERIRSDSASRPDNIWGFPSYALAEAVSERTFAPLWQVLVEPIWADYYTPKAGRVLAGLEREAKRIGWSQMLVKGQVKMIRKRKGGGYFIILTQMAGSTAVKHVAYRADFVHLAVGYPGLKLLPELQEFRMAHQDFYHLVSAYERHEHVYQAARTKHLVVMLRGGGIVATQVLQRLMDDRAEYGLSTEIVHLFRTYVTGSHGPSPWNRRRGGNGFAYQGFSYPKAVWGGQLYQRMRKLEGEKRVFAYRLMGGTNTPWRRRQQAQMTEGRTAGWYRTVAGTVDSMQLEDDGKIVSKVRTRDGMVEVAADFVIDCTGLDADIGEHEVIVDLLMHSGVGRNPLGRLDVERTFELRGARSGPGVMYASGAITLGGYLPGVDTFPGLQMAAQEIADDLVRRGFCQRLGTFRSVAQWLRWARNKQP